MTFTLEQVAALKAPLDRSAVKSRKQGGTEVSYVEAYHAENEANRIFGFDAWDRETDLTLIGEPRLGKDKFGNDQWRVAYRAKVRITVRHDGGQTVREGCGFGSGIDKDVDQAHESALKEAESDAEKRALKTFGNPFGQALYNKAQTDVADTPPPGLSDNQRDIISGLADAANVPLLRICEGYKVKDLREIPAENFEAIKKRLNLTIDSNTSAHDRKAA